MSLADTLGRGLLANMFIQNGFGAFLEPDSRAKKVEAAGLPQPRQPVILNGALMVLGFLSRYAALSKGVLEQSVEITFTDYCLECEYGLQYFSCAPDCK